MDAELNEELIHLPQISSVPMRVQHRRRRHRVPHVDTNNLVTSPRPHLHYLHILPVREPTQRRQPRRRVRHQAVRRRIRREEGQLRRH